MWNMWRNWLRKILYPQSDVMSKTKPNQIHVHATKEGALYVKPSELFSAPKVQNIIKRMLNSDVLKESTKANQGG